MHIITFGNSKGGVAKSTSSVNVAGSLVRLGFKVLLIDLDSQGSSTMYLGVEIGSRNSSEIGLISLGDCFYRNYPLKEAIVKVNNKLDVLRGSTELALLDLYLAKIEEWYYALRNMIVEAELNYDFIILDTPPSLTPVTINAFVASTNLVIVTPPLSLDVSSLYNLLDEITDIRSLAPIGNIEGILLTRTRKLKTMQAHTKYLRKEFGDLVFDTEIKESVVLQESAANRKTIYDYKPRSASASQYKNFTKELLSRIL